MKRPATRTLVIGHPVIAVPLTLAGGIGLYASLYDNQLFPALLCLGFALTAQRASEEAGKYRAWKAEWDAMADGAAPRTATSGRVIGILLIAALMLAVYAYPLQAAYGVGYAFGWASQQNWLLTALGLLAAIRLVRFIRHRPRRPKAAKPVTVIAKPILPVPSLADAYRALPPYCHALLRGQA